MHAQLSDCGRWWLGSDTPFRTTVFNSAKSVELDHVETFGYDSTMGSGESTSRNAKNISNVTARLSTRNSSRRSPVGALQRASTPEFRPRFRTFPLQAGRPAARTALPGAQNHSKNKDCNDLRLRGRNRARTCDPLRVRQVLYQLSYSPDFGTRVSAGPLSRQMIPNGMSAQ